jgi:hypothetical protein
MSRKDAIRRQMEDSDYGDRGWYTNDLLPAYKAREGDNFLDIIPPEREDEYFGRKIYVHYDVGPDKEAVLCLTKMKKEPCPICEERGRLVNDDDIKALYPTVRYLYIVVDRLNRDEEKKGPQLYDAPATVNREILALSKNPRTSEVIDISDPDEGKTLYFERIGKTKTSTKYEGFRLIDRDEPIPDEWLDIPTFDEILVYKTYEEIDAMFGGSMSVHVAPESELDSEPPLPSRSRGWVEEKESSKGDDGEQGEEDRRPRMRRIRENKESLEPPSRSGYVDDREADESSSKVSEIRERLRRRREMRQR